MSKRIGIMVAMSLLIAVVAVWAAVSPDGGLRRLRLTSTSTTQDTGTGFYNLAASGSDSAVNYGIFFRSKISSAAATDSIFATPGSIFGGTPYPLTGSITASSGAATFYVNVSDTAKISISATFSDSNTAATGSWAGGSSNSSGSAYDSRVYSGGNGFETQSRMSIAFTDSQTAGVPNFNLSGSLRTATNSETYLTNATETALAIFASGGNGQLGGFDTASDTIRLVVFGDAGNMVVDTALHNGPFKGTTNGDTMFVTGNIKFDTGTNTIVVFAYDADTLAYTVKMARVVVGPTAIPTNVSTDSSPSQTFTTVAPTGVTQGSLVSKVTVTLDAAVQNSIIQSVQIVDAAQDTGFYSDAYKVFDSATSGLDTRVGGSVFQITLRDAAGNQIHDLGSQKILVTTTFNFSNFSAATVSGLNLLHLDHDKGTWETVSGATIDSATGTIVAYLSKFSHFGLGHISGGSTLAASSSSDCVIDNAIGGTTLAGLMPSLRSVRDSFLSTSIGRSLVSGYYAFGGMLLLMVAGSSLAFASSRREN